MLEVLLKSVLQRGPVQSALLVWCGLVLIGTIYNLVPDTLAPRSPASSLLEPIAINQARTNYAGVDADSNIEDFATRPLFSPFRVPDIAPSAAADGSSSGLKGAETERDAVESIDGISLLGIFTSEEASGVIVRLENGRRERLFLGNELNGWKLTQIDSRSAELESATGEQATLGLLYSDDQEVLAAITGNPNSERQQVSPGTELEEQSGEISSEGDKQETEDAEGQTKSNQGMTFDYIYNRRYQDLTSNEEKPDPEADARETSKNRER